MEQPQGSYQGRKPRQQAQARHHHRRNRSGRRLRSRFARRTGLQRQGVLHPGFAPPRPLDRRTGRYQRREELPERQRLDIPSVLRHDQGRRLPRPRGQRLPPGRGLEPHHRSVRGTGRALRPRVRRPAGQPFVRRRAGIAHLLRPRTDRPAASARRLRGPEQGDRRRLGEELPAPRDARHRHRGRRGARHHRPQPRDGRDRDATARTPS